MQKTTQSNERLMRDLGRERYRSRVRQARERGRETDTVAGRYLLKECVGKVQTALQAWMENSEAQLGKGQHCGACYPFLKLLPVDVTSLLSVKILLDAVAAHRDYKTVCIYMGTMLEEEAKFRTFDAAFPSQSRHVLKKAQQSGFRKFRKEVDRVVRAFNVDWTPWSRKDRCRVGILLLEVIRQHTGLVEISSYRDSKGKIKLLVSPEKETLDWLEQSHEEHEVLFPFYLPTVTPPADWEALDSGGYLTSIITKRPLVRHDRIGSSLLKNHAMPEVYSAVNTLQQTAWEVNPRVYDTMLALWDQGGNVADFPAREDEPRPEKPLDFNADPGAARSWKRLAKLTFERNQAARSKRVMLSKVLFMAREFVGNRIYYPLQLDFRGRIYPVPFFLQPQGPSQARGLLQFAEAKPVRSDEAFEWWMIHGANSFGIDKVTFEERIKWVKDAATEILDCGKDPLGNLWWTGADKPWEFLAFCLEYSDWQASGRLESKLPIQMDGSNNGLQIYSLLLRDQIGGAATNCLPALKPQDIYQQVADLVTQKLLASTELFAKQWLGFLSGGRLPRSACKRPVMTLPYGSTRFSCHQYVMDWFLEEQKKRDLSSKDTWRIDFYTPCHWLGKLIWESIDEVVVAAKSGMLWLKQVSDIAASEGHGLTWTTPSGFLVRQHYTDYKKARIQTIYGGVVRDVLVRDHGNKLSKRLQRNGVAPNFVHSLDASVLTRTVNLCAERGMTDFMTIHDAFGCHAADAPLMAEMLRRACVEIFTKDVLGDFRNQIQGQVTAELPPLPAYGDLDVSELMSSKYFFA